MRKYTRYFRRVFLTKRYIDAPPVILIWWGSYGYKGGPTLGDLCAVNNMSEKLAKDGVDHAVISHPELGIESHLAVSDIYAIKPVRKVVFVCGPITDNQKLRDFLSIHSGARKLAVGVSVLANQEKMNSKFDCIIARDGTEQSFFDLAISDVFSPDAVAQPRTLGVCLRGKQGEYGMQRAGLSEKACDVAERLISKTELEPIMIDTVLSKENTPQKILSEFAASDIVLTTRMHGALLSLAAGKPVIALDQIPGGAKVSAVVGKTGWPFVYQLESVSSETIDSAFADILSPAGLDQLISAQARTKELSHEALLASANAIAAN